MAEEGKCTDELVKVWFYRLEDGSYRHSSAFPGHRDRAVEYAETLFERKVVGAQLDELTPVEGAVLDTFSTAEERDAICELFFHRLPPEMRRDEQSTPSPRTLPAVRVWNGSRFVQRTPSTPFAYSGFVVVFIGRREVYLAQQQHVLACADEVERMLGEEGDA